MRTRIIITTVLLTLATASPGQAAEPSHFNFPHIVTQHGIRMGNQTFGDTQGLGVAFAEHWTFDVGWIHHLDIDDSSGYFEDGKFSLFTRIGYSHFLLGDWAHTGWRSKVSGQFGYLRLSHDYSHEDFGFSRRAHALQTAASIDLGYRFASRFALSLQLQAGADFIVSVDRDEYWSGQANMEGMDRVQGFGQLALSLEF